MKTVGSAPHPARGTPLDPFAAKLRFAGEVFTGLVRRMKCG